VIWLSVSRGNLLVSQLTSPFSKGALIDSDIYRSCSQIESQHNTGSPIFQKLVTFVANQRKSTLFPWPYQPAIAGVALCGTASLHRSFPTFPALRRCLRASATPPLSRSSPFMTVVRMNARPVSFRVHQPGKPWSIPASMALDFSRNDRILRLGF
jgi:hypothetical protein